MQNSDCFVSVIAPIYNDARIIESFVSEVMEILNKNYQNYELVLVNDGSEDDTVEKASFLLKNHECIRIINLSRKFGTDVAISSGLDSVIGDFVVVMIPASDPPQLIPQLIEQARNGKDILIGVRENRFDEPFWMRIGTTIFYLLCQQIFQIPLIINSTQFRVLSRQVVNAVVQVQDKHRYLRLLSFYIGYNSQTFTYKLIKRYRIHKTKKLIESVDIALQLIVANSMRPLRIVSYFGLSISFINMGYIGYIFGIYLFKEKVAEGWVTLSLQNAAMFFFISLILTILCEYIGVIIDRSKGFSSYYVAEEINSSLLIVDPEKRNVVNKSNTINI